MTTTAALSHLHMESEHPVPAGGGPILVAAFRLDGVPTSGGIEQLIGKPSEPLREELA